MPISYRYFSVWQPPFETNLFEDPGKQITLLANPGSFQIDKVTVCCCSMDILRHLSSEELSHGQPGASTDRLARLASHIVGQRSFYPLFPAAPGVPLDLSIAPEAMNLPCTPDILILPSDLAPFVKVLSSLATNTSESSGIKSDGKLEVDQVSMDFGHVGTICVNPGRLAKGVMGGTFVEMLIPTASEDLPVAQANKNLLARTKVVVTRI
ncbi:hypothetical protein O6H91_Y045400 [Diphasiastrum complanatum]|nr:hypothetical protein O6H91_Y045400 [Diphasiastrum complanatum]